MRCHPASSRCLWVVVASILALSGCGGGGTTPTVYSVGGTVSGLTGTVILENNGANDLSISANGAFAFSASTPAGGTYNVAVLSQPVGQTCLVAGGTGSVSTNVLTVALTCTTNTFAISGSVKGLVRALHTI